jgi:predicted MFS family arabinose efflux permease
MVVLHVLNLGVVAGSAIGGTSYVVVLGAVARVVPPEKRSSIFGLITAAGSLGMFAVVPGVQWLIASAGWQTSFAMLAVFVGSTAILAIGFPGKTGNPSRQPSGKEEIPQSLTSVLNQARRHSGYLLLTAGFFVCGFHVAFIATHLPAFLADESASKMTAATSLAMIGLFNIFGSYLFGARYLSTLYGIVFFSHQIGSFLGVWLGGRVYDMVNSYDMVWILAILLGVTAAILHLPITDQPVKIVKYPQPSTTLI